MAQNNSIKVNSSIFEAFNRLTQEDEKVRIIGAATLIKILEETNEEKVTCTCFFFFEDTSCNSSLNILGTETIGLCSQTSY